MAKQKMKYTNEELNAMRINAMLQGLNVEDIQNEPLDEDDIEIVIEDEKPSKKSKKKKEKEEPKPPKQYSVPVLPEYENLVKSGTINVSFKQHDIHYKDQFWNIDHRVVEYNIELVTVPKVARDCSDIVNHNDVDEANKAYNGEVRYYKVVTYENVLAKVREIGYVKVWCQGGKLKNTVVVNKKLLKESYVDSDRVIKSIKDKLPSILK